MTNTARGNHTGAELQCFREALGFTREAFADRLQVAEVSVRKWEEVAAGHRRSVPDFAWEWLERYGEMNDDHILRVIDTVDEPGSELVLLAYRSDEDLAATGEELMTAKSHRLLLHKIKECCEHADVRIIWFDRVIYDAWRAANGIAEDNQALRAAWAQLAGEPT